MSLITKTPISTSLSQEEARRKLALAYAERDRRRAIEEQKQEEIARIERVRENCKTLRGFVAEAWHVLEPSAPFVPCWHNDAECEHLEAITRGEIQRLQINQPPGTMKSLTASVLWEAWEWGPANLPGLRYLTTSYQESYARRDSRKHRDLVMSEWYQKLWPSVVLERDNETDFENTAKGGRRAMPFGSLTAGRGNRLVIDDPHSTEEVESDADRERAARIFRESVPSRLNDPKTDAILVIMHRLHPEDVCGVIEQLGLPYVKLILPMEYVKSTTVSTKWFIDPRKEDGELLCPNRVPREVVEQNKLELGPHAYDTQYQQMPRAREGSYFFSREQLLVERAGNNGTKTYEPLDFPKSCDAVFAVVDSASKVERKHDGTGVTYFAYSRHPTPSAVILDWDISQMEASLLTVWLPTVFSRLEELARLCGAKAGSVGAWVEDKDSGVVLLQHAARNNWPARAIDSKMTSIGKEARAVSIGGYVNKNQVKISRPAYDKVTIYKGRSRNHFLYQVTTYRMGVGTSADEDELFDTFCYGVGITLGNADAF